METVRIRAFETEPRFRVLTREVLFEETGIYTNTGHTYDVAPDNERFLVVKMEEAGDSGTAVILLQNWSQELLDRAPVPS